MATANDNFLDALIRHQIGLMRLSGSVRNQIFALLDATEADLKSQIRSRIKYNAAGIVTTARLQRLLEQVEAIRNPAWQEVESHLFNEMSALAAAESAFLANAVTTVLPVQVDVNLPEISVLQSIVRSRPFEGKTLRAWAQNMRQTDLDMISRQIQIGITQGESSIQISRRVVGSAAFSGTDGITQTSRRNAAAVVQTAVNAISNQTKREFYIANKDIAEQELYVATLDSRTTRICSSLDGDFFPIGEGPLPPLHFNCRSVRVIVFNDQVLGNRPAVPVTQRILLREYSQANGLPSVTSRGALPRGHRGRFDDFKRGRVSDLVGQVPARVNYEQFLRRQSVEFQNETLGATKARLFRRGNLSLDRFVNRQGDELTLSQLVKRDRQAFIDAGLNPDNFT